MDTIRASSKGQIVIPKAIRESLDIRSGTELGVELIPGEGFKVTRRSSDHVAQVGKLAGSLAVGGRQSRCARLSDNDVVALLAQDNDTRIRASSRSAKRKRK